MKLSRAERQQIENEMIFRRANEKVGTDLDDLDAMHRKDGHFNLVRDENLILHFKCECSDENCSVRIPLLLTEYRAIHLNRNTFIVKTNHQVDMIEKVVMVTPTYSVVKKNNSTPEPSDVLNITSINNS
ncbi:MAG: hypothetical protein JWO54_221 [Candidatus Saccharibacteria bacterium]|nr:hypothetical protein [Candidatus Saccharibacteria bacterium]MDB5180463.1 hypothetical protein [Candidatus Saccharibacteria bacterium]